MCAASLEAFAQQEPLPEQEQDVIVEPLAPPGTILAPSNALELQFEAGYTQPFGRVSATTEFDDVAHAGFVGGGALVYRISPLFALVGFGGFHHSVADEELDGGMVFGGAGGVGVNFHMLPFNLVDPYVMIGAGYRLLFVAPGSTADNHMFHGFEVLKASFGVDFRTSDSFAIGPIIGADLNTLLWDLNTTTGTNERIQRESLSTFVFAGVSGKFDLLGERVPQYEVKEPLPAAGPPLERVVRPVSPEPASVEMPEQEPTTTP